MVFRYHPDIQNGFWENFGQIMATFCGCVASLKKDITKIFRLRKALISWRYMLSVQMLFHLDINLISTFNLKGYPPHVEMLRLAS